MPSPLEIVVTLAGASQASAGLKSVETAMGNVGAVIGAVVPALAPLAAAFAGLRQAVNAGDELADMAARLGTSVKELVVLRRALDLVGASAGALPPAISAFQRSLSGLSEDGSATGEVFGRLGLAVASLRTLPLTEQLAAVSAKMQALPSQADRVAVAMKLFGRGGTEIMPMLVDGQAIAQAAREAGGLAAVMDRNANAFGAINDKVGEIGLHWQEVNAIVAERTLPLFTAAANALNSIDPASAANGMQRGMELSVVVGGYLGIRKLGDLFSAKAKTWGETMLVSSSYGASKVQEKVATSLIGLQGSLAKILPWGLAAAVATEIGLGMYQARADEKNRLSDLRGATGEAVIARINKLKAIGSAEELEAFKAETAARLAQLAIAEKEVQTRVKHNRRTGDFYSPEDTAKLAAINQEKQGAESSLRVASDEARMAKQIAEAQAKAAAARVAQVGASRQLFEWETQLAAAQTARNQPEIDRVQRLIEEQKLKEQLKPLGAEAPALVAGRLAVEDAARSRARQEQTAALALTNQQTEAELAGNRAKQDDLKLEELAIKLRRDAQALGPAGEAEVQKQLALERQRLALESARALLAPKLTAAEAALARVEATRGTITANTLLDEATKRQRLTENTKDYLAALSAVVNLKLQEANLAKDPAELAALDAQITALNNQAGTYGKADLQPNRAERAQAGYDNRANETDHYQSAGAGMKGGAQDFVTSLGTAADNAAEAVTGTLNSALSSTSDLLYNVISGATSMKDAWGQATLAIGQSFLRMITDMVAKMIWRNTIERALTMIGVTTHVAGEGAKTAATTTGGGIRMLVWIKEALASVYKGALEAFSALASIPYVGPFLGAAAMAAAIGGGIALVAKIGHADGGLITGPGGPRDDRVPAMLSAGEYVIPAHRVAQYGPGFFDALRNGSLNLAALSANAQGALADRGSALQAASAPAAAAAASSSGGGEAPNVHVAFGAFNNQQHAKDWLSSQDGERYMVNFLKRRGYKNG